MATHLLLIDCPDEPGLVYTISGIVFHHGFNVVSNHEFVDPTTGHFFMRTAVTGAANPEAMAATLRQRLPTGAGVRLASTEPRPIVLLVTKEPHCIGDLLLRHDYGDLPARILAVVGNHDVLRPLVERFDVPFHLVGHEGKTRAEHEAAMLEVIDGYAPEYLVLAKYMRVLSPGFVARYEHRILNIHHSFLPAFVGARPYHQAFERGVKMVGATAHIVTDDLDTGPILHQSVEPVDHAYTAADMARAGRDIERQVLATALRLLLEERVFLHHNRSVVFA